VSPPARRLLVTDLDGTLLDADTYDPGPAAAALRRVLDAGIEVAFCSSKTRAEQEALARDLGVDVTLVVENGAAILPPGGPPTVLGQPYETVRDHLRAAAEEARIEVRGYGDMPPQEVAERTGLDPEAATRARAREYSESFLVTSDEEPGGMERLERALASRGLRMIEGARFLTACGEHDKGVAIRRLVASLDPPPLTYGIGDHHNDVEMLEAVDVAVLVARPDGGWAAVPVDGLVRIPRAGPVGWVEAADMVLAEVNVG
jgi:mannosyl-3-phosphoglycerate phosphatase